MQEEIKEWMRQKLLTVRSEVIEALIAENNDFRSAVEDIGVKDLADVAANDIDARTLEAVGAKDRNRLLSIDAALVRLENGRFGLCAGCGTRISQERLEAIPYAVMCINCQFKSEKSRTH